MNRKCCRTTVAGLALLTLTASLAAAQTAPSLGTAQSFAVLGGSAVTNTGPSVITGDLGVSPGTAVTGFPPGIVSGGTIHIGDAVALQAQNDLTTAYNNLASQTCTQDLTGQDLGGKTLTAGTYCFSSSAQLTGTLTLNALGDPNAVFVFKIGSTLTTASNSLVLVNNSGQTCRVFWQVGSSATLGTGTTMAGNILALTSISMTTNARIFGRALARNGAVTLDTNTADASICGVAPPTCPVISLAPATLPNGSSGVAYSQTITGSGGAAPYTFTLVGGLLPSGLTLSSAGVVAGTPTAQGIFTFKVRGTDSNGCFAERSYTIVIAAPGCPAILFSPATLPNGAIQTPYSQTFVASGGTAPYTFTVTAGALPAGLTLTAAGVLSGTPSTAASYGFTIRATDAGGCFVERSYVVIISTSVPTLPQWAMIILAVLLGLSGVMAIRRRRV